MKHSKKGLSEIVTSILIILIAVAAVVVIWQVLLPLIRSPGEESASLADCTANPVSISNIICNTGGTVTARVSKMGTKSVASATVTFENALDGSEDTSASITNPQGTSTVQSTAGTSYTGDKVAVAGTYQFTGSTVICNIPVAIQQC